MPDVSLWGAVYPDVTEVELPVNGGGTATFSYGGVSPTSLLPVVMRPDATLLTSWSHDAMLQADDGITIPAYSTSAQNLGTVTTNSIPALSANTYSYIIVERAVDTPIYSDTSVGSRKVLFCAASQVFELSGWGANSFSYGGLYNKNALINSLDVYPAKKMMPYVSSGTNITLNTSATYGFYETIATPTQNGTAWNFKTPQLAVRGSTTYFNSAAWNLVTDVRRQWRIDVWQVPKANSLNLDGWAIKQAVESAIDAGYNGGTLKTS